MYKFKLEPLIQLLTVTRTGFWSLDTVKRYEEDLRQELEKLHTLGRPTAFIIDIRSSGAQAKDVAEALRSVVARLGPLHANRTAVVTSSGIAKLQAKRIADENAQVFTSMVLARDWIMGSAGKVLTAETVYDEPSDAAAEGAAVHVQGPANVDVVLTPKAALETGKRISDAAIEALIGMVSERPLGSSPVG